MTTWRNLRNKRRLIQMCLQDEDFDYEYLLRFEYIKLNNMYEYFTRSRLYVDHHRDVQRMQVCIKLLNIIINEKSAKVNVRNYFRFHLDKEICDKYPQLLYLEKAKCLYYEMRKNWTDTWWD